MSVNKAKFPDWDGTTPTRESRLIDAEPSYEDWDQLVAEVLEIQRGFFNLPITSLIDGTGGTIDNTLEQIPGTTAAANATAANNNFADLNAALDNILVALRNARIIRP